MSFVDPSSLIDQRVQEAVAPLRQQLVAATNERERRKLRRSILRVERKVRKSLSSPVINW